MSLGRQSTPVSQLNKDGEKKGQGLLHPPHPREGVSAESRKLSLPLFLCHQVRGLWRERKTPEKLLARRGQPCPCLSWGATSPGRAVGGKQLPQTSQFRHKRGGVESSSREVWETPVPVPFPQPLKLPKSCFCLPGRFAGCTGLRAVCSEADSGGGGQRYR